MNPALQVIVMAWWGRGVAASRSARFSAEGVIGLARDVALEAADDLALGLAFGGATLRVGAGAVAAAQAADGDHVQAAVGVAVAAVVEAVSRHAPRGGRDRLGPRRAAERPSPRQRPEVLGSDHQP